MDSVENLVGCRLTYYGYVVGDNDRLERGQGRNRANPAYANFKESMAMEFRSQWGRRPPVAKRKTAGVKLYVMLPKKMDSTSVIKPVLDAIELAGIYSNDRLVNRTETIQHPDPSPDGTGVITVELWGDDIYIPEELEVFDFQSPYVEKLIRIRELT